MREGMRIPSEEWISSLESLALMIELGCASIKEVAPEEGHRLVAT